MGLSTLENFPETSVYHIPAGTDSNDYLFFIPGNPGLVEYYITYLDLIHEKYNNFHIYCLSHAGYQTTGDYEYDSKNYYDLQYQIDHKIDIVNSIIPEKANVYFMAHSLGAYITQRVVDPLLKQGVSIKFVGFICPTIVNLKDSESGQLFSAIYKYLPVVRLALIFSFIMCLLGESSVKHIFRKYVLDPPKENDTISNESLQNSIDASYKLITTKRIVRQALTLVVDELDMILHDDEFNDWFFSLSENGVKIWNYFAYKDHWVHDTTRDYILDRYFTTTANLRFDVGELDGMTHSFCVNQSKEVALTTLEVFDEFL